MMKIKLLLLLFVLPLLMFAQIPRTDRSDKAVEKCTKNLETETCKAGFKCGSPVYIRIFKETSELEVWMQKGSEYKLFKTYQICYYSGDLGPKTKQGDRQSPEGFYKISPSQLNPASSYHLSFNVGYPNEYERKKGYTGSSIMVHGSCASIGCFAMTDERIEEIWTLVYKAFENKQKSIPVHIFPFRMTDQKLCANKENKWYGFWQNLKEGYDYFEKHKTPPVVSVNGCNYCFR